MRSLSLLAVFLFATGCVGWDYFGLNDDTRLLGFEVVGQAGPSVIDQDSLRVDVPVSSEVDLSSVVPTLIQVGSLATVSPSQGERQDFRQPVEYTVTAEDGSSAIYLVSLVVQGSRPQLQNSSFDQWYEVTASGKTFHEPGESADSIWSTGNRGVVTLAEANTTPVELGQGDFYARLETRALPVLLGSPHIAAGSLFTGDFEVNLADPASSAILGVPFTARPTGFTVEYRYFPGDENLDEDRVPLPYPDAADIYILLENRVGATIERVATGWFRTDLPATEWTLVAIDLVYGDLGPNAPAYAVPEPGQSYAVEGTRPTHISVVFSSSAEGDFFRGAYGSVLEINDLTLLYD